MAKKKQVNRKRSLAMKKSWKLRRNSPGRTLARDRWADRRKAVSERVAKKRGRVEKPYDDQLEAEMRQIRSLRSEKELLQEKVKELHEEKTRIRRMLASNKLDAMIQSAPMCDRLAVDENVWAKKAIAFADALLKELNT